MTTWVVWYGRYWAGRRDTFSHRDGGTLPPTAELGKSEEEIEAAIKEAEMLIAKRREEMRRRL